MKKINSLLMLMVLCASVQSQILNKKNHTGSWINIEVVKFYEYHVDSMCDDGYFYYDKVIPFYLSFKNKDQVQMIARIEQESYTYKVNSSNTYSIFMNSPENQHKIYISNDTLQLKYNKNLMFFKKVSDNYSSDVYREYIKGLIFRVHKNFVAKFFMEKKFCGDCLFNEANFINKIKNLFKCESVDFFMTGAQRMQNSCLPVIGLYYNTDKKYIPPRVLGILIKNDEVKFIDESGVTVLTLKSIAQQ